MSGRGSWFICIVLLIAFVLGAGCSTSTAPEDTPGLTQPATPPGTPVASAPAALPATPFVTVPADTTAEAVRLPDTPPAPVKITWTPAVPSRGAVNDPQVVELTFTKNYFRSTIPDCGMRVAFPQVASNTDYGIRSASPTLTAFSEDQILLFLKTYALPYSTEDLRADPYLDHHIDPNAIGGARCSGVPVTPTWNFVLINATIMPRNARPADYAIGINVRSHGTVAGQLNLNRTLVLDQPVVYGLFVPLKSNEMDSFDSVAMVFSKMS